MNLDLSYVLPLRWSDDAGLAELTGYLRWLVQRVEVIVVDGSPPALLVRHAAHWVHRYGTYHPIRRCVRLYGRRVSVVPCRSVRALTLRQTALPHVTTAATGAETGSAGWAGGQLRIAHPARHSMIITHRV